jgi:hypothetical protein
MSHCITRILEKGPEWLRLRFDDGSVRAVNVLKEAARGPAWAPLADPDYVKGVRRAWGGYLLQWPDGVTWSAEVVWEEGEVQRPPTANARPDTAQRRQPVKPAPERRRPAAKLR